MSFGRHRIEETRLPAALLIGLWVAAAPADITLDGSLGPGGPLSGPDFQIPHTVGRTVGSNLFHSFGEFNIFSGESATFSGPDAIDNVFGRVTGGDSSTINGALRSTIPTADVYLVNPQGLMFGPEATLDVQGSFYASTADHVLLRDGGRFDVTNPNASVLTTAPPEAFGFLGPSPAPITVTGSTLTVPDGETLALVGGDVTLTEATVNVPGGEVGLVGVGAGEARLGSIDVSAVTRFADVTVTDSSIELSGEPGGSLWIRGGQIVIDSPDIVSLSFGPEDGGDISFKGETIIVRHEEQRPPQGTPFSIDAAALGPGHGGDITFEADNIRLLNGLGIFAWGEDGPGGDISFEAREFEARFSVSIFAETYSDSPGGDVFLNADSILIAGDDAFRFTGIGTDTLEPGSGQAGDLIVNANTIELLTGGNLANFSEGPGPGGDVFVQANSILMDRGGAVQDTQISSDTFGAGPAGDVVIAANHLEMLNGAGIGAAAFGSGSAGNVELNVDRLEVLSGSDINTVTFNGTGRAGDITITADSVLVSADGLFEHPLNNTGIQAFTTTTEDAGDVIISARSLEIHTGIISAFTAGPGSGGNLSIEADRVVVDGGGIIAPPPADFAERGAIGLSVISAGSQTPESGPAGNVEIKADEFIVRGGGLVESSTQSINPGGNITVTADQVRVENNSRIDTATFGPGAGGNITVDAGKVVLTDRGKITASSTGSGTAGAINISAYELHLTNGAEISTNSAMADGGNVNVMAEYMVYLRDSAITTSVGDGSGAGGNVFIDPVFVVLDRSRIEANAFGGPGGNILIVTEFFIASSDSVVEASSQQDVSGTVDVRSPDTDVSGGLVLLPAEYLDSASQLSAQCAARGGQTAATLIGVGRGGLPVPPGGPMLVNYTAGQTDTAIEGLRAAVLEQDRLTSAQPSPVDLAEFVPQTLRLECKT